jgi:hypothetical protein
MYLQKKKKGLLLLLNKKLWLNDIMMIELGEISLQFKYIVVVMMDLGNLLMEDSKVLSKVW